MACVMRRVKYKDTEISYSLQRKDVKNINLRVGVDGTVRVSAPKYVNLRDIDDVVLKHGDYILKSLEKFAANRKVSSRDFKDGDTVYIFGELVTVRIRPSRINSVALENGELILGLEDPYDQENIKLRGNAALAYELYEAITQIFKSEYRAFASLIPKVPTLKYKHMKSAWGICAPAKNTITFNLGLVHVPKECIEYVVDHELTHFLYPDHSRNFKAALEKVCPRWRERRETLKEYVSLIE